MPVRYTSREAFSLGRRYTVEHEVVAELTTNGPATRLQLAERLDRGVNTLTAAVLSLIAAQIIKETDRVVQVKTGKRAWVLDVTGDV